MRTDFTLDGYRALVSEFLKRGYTVCGFEDASPHAAHLILRHDIDMSIQRAVALAEVERELAVRSHYFVLLRTEMYNPFSAAGANGLRRLVELGHDLGLHFDASLYPEERTTLEAAAEKECAALEMLLQEPVRFISFHRPEHQLLGFSGSFAGRCNVYEQRFFEEIGYCSDSRGGWHHGHPLDHPNITAGRALQLNTHPVWWDAYPGEGVKAKLDRFATERFDLLRCELGRNCGPYGAALARLFGDERLLSAPRCEISKDGQGQTKD